MPDLASSSDEEAPFQRSLKLCKDNKTDRKAGQGKGKVSSAQQGGGSAAGGVKGTRSVGGGSGTGGGGAAVGKTDENSIRQLLDETDKEMQVLKVNATLSDIKLESLESLSARLASKKTGLGKKAGKDSSTTITNLLDKVNSGKVQVSSVVEVIKVVLAFQKKRSRKLAVAVGEKMHAMRARGVTLDVLCNRLSAKSSRWQVINNGWKLQRHPA